MKNNGTTRILLLTPVFDYFPAMGMAKKAMNYTRPPLGICYLASYIEKMHKGPVKIAAIDGMITKREKILRFAAGFRPHVVGISATTAGILTAKAMAADIRSVCGDAVIVAGGPHVCTMPTDAFPEFDLAVVGEGEKAFLEIVEQCREPVEKAVFTQAVMKKGDGGPAPTPLRITNLDELPFPARQLLPMESYFHSYPHRKGKGLFTTLFTSRGCGFHCSYCGGDSVFPGKKQYFSIDYVKDELDHVVSDLKCSLIFFDDDEFLLDKGRLVEICEHILSRGVPFRWICHARPEGADPALFRLMKSAGCVEMQVGVESGSEDILLRMNRRYGTDQVRAFFRAAGKTGIRTWATYVLGHPGETISTLEATLNLARETDPTYASFILLLPFPGTRVHDELKSRGRLLTLDWSRYSWHSGEAVFRPETMSPEELVAHRGRMFRSFYLRPGKLARLGLDTVRSGSWREMTRNFLAWISISF